MAQTVDDITITYEENDVEIVKQLDKQVLTKGAWTTILFRYQEYDRGKGEYGPEKYVIRRYQKKDGNYSPRSKFVISSAKQARQIIEILSGWLGD